jgi:hypothetical protein
MLIEYITGAALIVFIFCLGLFNLWITLKGYSRIGFSDEELVKMEAKGVKAYWSRTVDILFFLLIAVLIQSFTLRFGSSVCPLKSSYARTILYSGLAMIPFALGYIWTMLPYGRKGLMDAVLFKLEKAEETADAKIHKIIWRPWTGIVYILFYLAVVFFSYLSLRVKLS